MSILRRYSPVIEPVSIDEAFLDAAGSESLHGSPRQIALSIKAAIRDELSLTASVGVATTKLVAKVASDLDKPDGLVVVEPGDEAGFLAPLPIARLWGVGERTAVSLSLYGVRTIGDLAALPADLLMRRFGRQGPVLAARARGIDPSPVAGVERARSVSHEHTFEVDTTSAEEIEATLLALSEGVAARLREGRVTAQTVGVKVRDQAFETLTRQRTLPAPTDSTDVIWHTSLDLARPLVRGVRIRLLGVAASHLVEEEQLELFGSLDDRRRRATAAADDVRRRFGSGAIVRGRLLGGSVAEPFERDPMKAPEARRVGRTSTDPAVETKDDGSG